VREAVREAVRESWPKVYPHPGCFLQEWQTKNLGLTRLVRVANAGLKVVVFSGICGRVVRVANKGVSGGELRAALLCGPEEDWEATITTHGTME